MVNNKLHRLPAWMLSLLAIAVLSLGLTTAACNDSDKGVDDIVGKLVLTIPIDDGSKDSTKVAPETVKYYQISGFDKDGLNTYCEQFNRDKTNTNDDFTSITLRKGRNQDGEIVGITYGTTSILVNYLDGDKAFLGYTLFTGLDLASDRTKEIIVDNVVLTNMLKKHEAMTLSMASTVKAAEVSAKGETAAQIDYDCIARVDDMIQLNAVLAVKPNPANSDKAVELVITDTDMVSFAAPADDPDSEGDVVLKPWSERVGAYRCAGTGTSVINVSFAPYTGVATTCYVLVTAEDALGTLNVALTPEFVAELAAIGQVSYAVIGDDVDNRIPVEDSKFSLKYVGSISGAPVVTFYDADDNALGSCPLPDVTFTEDDQVIDITIPAT